MFRKILNFYILVAKKEKSMLYNIYKYSIYLKKKQYLCSEIYNCVLKS